MLVMKFGGTSVADADRLRHAAALVLAEPGPVVVVTSALGGITDELLRAGRCAEVGDIAGRDAAWAGIAERHRVVAGSIGGAALVDRIEPLLAELEELLHGVALIGELSFRSGSLLVSFGERLAAPMLAEAIVAAGGRGESVDAREIIVAVDGFGGPAVDLVTSRDRTRARLLDAGDRIAVVTGFIASDESGRTTTLGRGGSDWTATLLGSFLEAREVIIWTDVDGVMTADPRIVPEARVLDAVTYREAAEMAYFGSKVLHPRSMVPAVQHRIPVVIRNTFHPERPGTRITDEPAASARGVKTVTSVGDLALVTIEGRGMLGVPGVSRRVFTVTAEAGVNVEMVSQASSEQNISLVVRADDGAPLVAALEREFAHEIERGHIDRIDRTAPVGIVAAIGEGMRGTPGVSQRFFTALGRARINVLAIAQGSSELNLSTAVRQEDLRRAVGAVHSRFGLTRDTHVFLLGKGLVGRRLLGQLVDARRTLEHDHGTRLVVIGVCGRTELLLDPRGLDDETLAAIADGSPLRAIGGEPRPDDSAILDRIDEARWLDVVVVDVTAEDHAGLHGAILDRGFHVVTANKRPMAGSMASARSILDAAVSHGVGYHYETTCAAGLPVLSTLHELVATGDDVRRVTGCFSGTLGFLCAALHEGRPLSETVREARALGYTEPDPRDDLSGLDVARKALIVARQLGAALEPDDVRLVPFVALDGDPAMDIESFLDDLSRHDEPMRARVRDAERDGHVLRYVAEITPTSVEVALRPVPADDPVGQLDGPDNIVVFRTGRYDRHPLVVRGPGAGAEVTAAGVLGDILRIVRAT